LTLHEIFNFVTMLSKDNDPQVYDKVNDIPFEPDSAHPFISYGAFSVVDKVKVRSGHFADQSFADRSFVRKLFIRVQKDDVEKVQEEAKILKEAQHDHVVKLVMTYIYESQQGMSFAMIMDRADENLECYLQNDSSKEPLGLEQIPQWFGCLLSTISFIHGKDIQHRDIKPASILIKNKKIILGGFGVSTHGKTFSTTVPGQPRERTPAYCAPEVEAGSNRGTSADMFSLGAVFLEMLIAHSYPKERQRLEALTTGDGKSYANNIGKVREMMENLEKGPQQVDWHSEILSFCRGMLDQNRDQRPSAKDLLSKWRTRIPLGRSLSNCTCAG
jgi:serine/threonine protein kinase